MMLAEPTATGGEEFSLAERVGLHKICPNMLILFVFVADSFSVLQFNIALRPPRTQGPELGADVWESR